MGKRFRTYLISDVPAEHYFQTYACVYSTFICTRSRKSIETVHRVEAAFTLIV